MSEFSEEGWSDEELDARLRAIKLRVDKLFGREPQREAPAL